MDAIETIEHRGYQIKIYTDEAPQDPRDDDNLGTMLCKHKNYDLGDPAISKTMSPEEIKEYVKRKDILALPLYLLDHSGLCMRTGRFACDSGGWDTSMVGYITVTFQKAKKELNKKKMSAKFKEKILSILEAEVKIYSDYLEGNIVGYVIKKEEEEFDSCWGFYPDHSNGNQFGYMIEECKSLIEDYVKEDNRLKHIQENVTAA